MLRWLLAPTLAGAMVAAAVVIPGAASAAGKPSLEPITAQALVAKAVAARVSHLSGGLSYTANVGLPDLSQLTDQLGSSSNILTWLSGTHTARVWYGGPTKVRVAVPVGSGEDDLVVNGSTAYIWKSGPYTVTRLSLPSHAAGPSRPAYMMPTPARVASQALSAIGPSTAVKVTDTAYVAGRPVYELVLTPRDSQSLVGRVVIAVDSATGLALRVQVFARGARSAALSFGFTSISFARPAASNFDFTPPRGAKVTTLGPLTAFGALGPLGPLGSGKGPITRGRPVRCWVAYAPLPAKVAKARCVSPTARPPARLAPVKAQQRPTIPAPPTGVRHLATPPGPGLFSVVGSGWGSVLVVPAADLQQGPAAGSTHGARSAISALRAFLGAGKAVSGPWGTGHLVSTALVDVLAVSNGPVLVGAVTPQALEAAAAHLP